MVGPALAAEVRRRRRRDRGRGADAGAGGLPGGFPRRRRRTRGPLLPAVWLSCPRVPLRPGRAVYRLTTGRRVRDRGIAPGLGAPRASAAPGPPPAARSDRRRGPTGGGVGPRRGRAAGRVGPRRDSPGPARGAAAAGSRRRSGVRQRLELLHRVDGGAVRGVRLALDHDLHEHRPRGGARLLARPLQGFAHLGGFEDPAPGAAVGLHDPDVVGAVVVVVDVDLEIHVERDLGLADEAEVLVVEHDQHARHVVLGGYGQLLDRVLEAVVADDPDDLRVGLGVLERLLHADGRGDLPAERTGLPADLVAAGFAALLVLAAPDLVQADGGDEVGIRPERLVDLLVHPRRLDGHRVEVLPPDQGRAQFADPLPPGADLGADLSPPRVVQQLPQEHPGVGDHTEIGLEDLPDLSGLDVDVDESAIAAVDVDLAGVAVREARADRQHQVRLQERSVAVALGGLDPGHSGVQGRVLVEGAFAHEGDLDGYTQVLGQGPQVVRGVAGDDAPAGQQYR